MWCIILRVNLNIIANPYQRALNRAMVTGESARAQNQTQRTPNARTPRPTQLLCLNAEHIRERHLRRAKPPAPLLELIHPTLLPPPPRLQRRHHNPPLALLQHQ